MPNMLREVGAIFSAFPFPALPYLPRSLATLFLYLSLFHFTPPLPVPKEVNKKLSYRRQNAIDIIKTHERNTNSEYCIYSLFIVYLSVLAGRIMLSTCPFVRPSVRSSVTNL